LLAANASVPLVGVIIAASAIASAFAIFSRFKAQAAQAANDIPTFRQGGKLVDGKVIGPSHEDGGVNVIDRRGRVYNIEGEEFVVNRKEARRRPGLLDAINTGKIDRMPAAQALALMGKTASNDGLVRVSGRTTERTPEPKLGAAELQALLNNHAAEIVEAIGGRPHIVPLPDGRVLERTKTATKERTRMIKV
jgi:hypothetical protein